MWKSFLTVFILACALNAQSTVVKARGSASAPIVIEVYSDYQCQFCKNLYEQTLVPLMADYVDKNKVYLIHHEYPVPIHAHAMEAACYAAAAQRVGKYEQVGAVLFRQQNDWSVTGKVDETVCSVLTPAEAKKVRELAKDPAIQAEVQRDIEAAQNAKIEGAPTMILTHRMKQYKIPGAASYAVLKRFIDGLLAD
jgi:protein-disulfide isomerase